MLFRSNPPEVLHYLAKAWNAAERELTLESLDFDPASPTGDPLPGFQRSKKCKGLNLRDNKTDSTHIYWNHDAREFVDWSF